MSRYERYNTSRNGVPVAVEHRDRDYHGPGYHEFDHEYRETELFDDERERTRDRELTRYNYQHENRSSGALIPVRQEKIIERDLYEVPPDPEPIIPIREIELDNTIKVTEHEHEHVHHHQHIHIDHGSIHIVAEKPPPPPPRKEINERETLIQIRERRYGGKWNATGRLSMDASAQVEQAHDHHHDFHHDHHDHHHSHSRSRSRSESREREVKRTIGYGRYRESPRGSTGALVNPSPRGSGFFKDFKAEQEGWTVVDVPGGSGRRITMEGSASADFSFGNAPIRRSSNKKDRTAQGELWTEITKDLVCAEALEEFGFPFEETDSFVYVFDYLHRDQIQDLIELTKDIRRERVREIERDSRYERSRSQSRPRNSGGFYERDRHVMEKRDFGPFERERHRDTREAVYY